MTTAVLVDDEANLLEHLEARLAQIWPDLEILGKAADGRQALAVCRDTQPDVVFLDIHMPGLDGLQVAELLPADTQIVFVTAFDEYALAAFERAAVDYLLKPITTERLTQTVSRLKSRAHADRAQNGPALKALLRELTENSSSTHLHWLRAGSGDTTELVSVDDVVYFKADQKYTSVFCPDREYVIRAAIKELAKELDPEAFWQVQRGTIVRVNEIALAQKDLRGRYLLTLKSRPEQLRVSQAYSYLFKQM